MTFRLSEGALIMAAVLCGQDGLRGGFSDELAGMSEQEVAANAEKWVGELESAGCLVLNFDGDTKPDPAFCADMKKLCAGTKGFTLDKRMGRKKSRLTVLTDAGYSIRTENGMSTVRDTFSKEELCDFLQLPAGEAKLKAALADTELVAHEEKKKLLSAGTDELTVGFLLADRAHRRIRLSVTRFDGENEEKTRFIYGLEGIAQTRLVYTDTREMQELTPVSGETLMQYLTQTGGKTWEL